MRNKAKFKELIRGQKPDRWITQRLGFSSMLNAQHCKVGYIAAKWAMLSGIENNPPIGFIVETLKEEFDLTETQMDHIYDLNDGASNSEEAERVIINYINDLRGTD